MNDFLVNEFFKSFWLNIREIESLSSSEQLLNRSVAKKCKAIDKFTHKSTEANKALVREAMREGIKFKKVVNPPNTR